MELVSAWYRRVSVPLHTTFAIAQGALTAVDSVLCGLRDSSGRLGLGEAAPFPVLTHDDAARAERTIGRLVAALCGQRVTAALGTLYQDLWPQACTDSITGCVAVEMALLDLRAQELRVPLAALFGDARLPAAVTDITLPILAAAELPAFWHRFSSYGFPYVKIKVGSEPVDAAVDRVLSLLRLAAPGTQISLDGNQGCTPQGARQLLATLKRAGVEPLLFEQPLPAADLAGMAALSAEVSTPICADESVCTAADAVRVIEQRAARVINLKFMKSGIAESQRIAALARAAGLELMIGGMVESELAMTASLHFYCGSGAVKYCDLDTPLFFSAPITDASPYRAGSARLELPARPGIGLLLRPQFLGG
jgi:L-alanine-DL-glutamate epimerase-like enolase superfamily enzyme